MVRDLEFGNLSEPDPKHPHTSTVCGCFFVRAPCRLKKCLSYKFLKVGLFFSRESPEHHAPTNSKLIDYFVSHPRCFISSKNSANNARRKVPRSRTRWFIARWAHCKLGTSERVRVIMIYEVYTDGIRLNGSTQFTLNHPIY